MKSKFNFLFGTALLIVLSTGENRLKDFSWLKGSWQMKKKNGSIIRENWESLNDSTMSGKSSYVSSSGPESVSETLSIILRDSKYYYVSIVKGQNNNQAVAFRITTFSGKGFIAENPKHDFPKRITYELVNQDSIHAFIDGGPSMPGKKSDFYYSRQKQ
ncbi:MAG TPA: DUF6265 family protein [Chitinophagaceae bacterium]|nr:DUF6265 family protein [Chitinophagaceae bacterium]